MNLPGTTAVNPGVVEGGALLSPSLVEHPSNRRADDITRNTKFLKLVIPGNNVLNASRYFASVV